MLLLGLVCGAVPLLSGLAVGAGVLRGLAASAVVVTMVTAATAMGDRMAARTLAAAALGVVPLASWIATDGADGVLLSSAVLLGVVALYQEHRPYGAAATSAAMGVGIAAIGPALGVVSSSATLAATRPVAFVGGQLLLLLAAVALHLLWWRFSEADQLVGEASMQEMVAVQRRMLSRMQDTERLKDELLAVVSHEFRTPLTAIIGFSQTLRRSASMGQLPAEMVELSADRIERNGLRLSRLIGNMLAATMDVEPHTERYFPISATIERLVEEFGGDDDGTTEVEVDVPEDMTARMSREHLRLLLGNLVDNGMKFADPGTPLRIRGRVAGDPAPDPQRGARVGELHPVVHEVAEQQPQVLPGHPRRHVLGDVDLDLGGAVVIATELLDQPLDRRADREVPLGVRLDVHRRRQHVADQP